MKFQVVYIFILLDISCVCWYFLLKLLIPQVFYVNIKSRKSSWVKPQGFVESEDELKKVSLSGQPMDNSFFLYCLPLQ